MGRVRIGVINLLGRAYINGSDNPFSCIDSLMEEISDCRIKIVDIHAEATAEKLAMGFISTARRPPLSAHTPMFRLPTKKSCPAAQLI